jgi:hypothetical protein
MIGVEEPDGQLKSCEPTRANVPEPATLPPSKLLKAMVRFVKVPFTLTGRLENQNAREFPPLGVGCMKMVKPALKVPAEPGPVI